MALLLRLGIVPAVDSWEREDKEGGSQKSAKPRDCESGWGGVGLKPSGQEIWV